jgi:hypothetical protein
MFQQTLNHTWKLMHAFLAKMEGRKYSWKQDFNENEIAEVSFFRKFQSKNESSEESDTFNNFF